MNQPELQAGFENGPLTIICGGGSLPFAVADAVMRRGRPVVLFAVRGWADPERVVRYRHNWGALGQFGRFCRMTRNEGSRDVVAIGSVLRPALSQIRLDWGTIKIFPRVVAAFRGGDNHMLSSLARLAEHEGFRLLGAHEVAPEILMAPGVLGGCTPSEQHTSDIARGLALIKAMGSFDVGQAVVVAGNHVVAVEAVEGTDQMLGRVAELRRSGRIRTAPGIGVLVKAPKPDQDRRFDLPTIGPRTIEGIAGAGLAGLAVAAGETIIAEPQAVAKAADQRRVFVVGLNAKEFAG